MSNNAFTTSLGAYDASSRPTGIITAATEPSAVNTTDGAHICHSQPTQILDNTQNASVGDEPTQILSEHVVMRPMDENNHTSPFSFIFPGTSQAASQHTPAAVSSAHTVTEGTAPMNADRTIKEASSVIIDSTSSVLTGTVPSSSATADANGYESKDEETEIETEVETEMEDDGENADDSQVSDGSYQLVIR